MMGYELSFLQKTDAMVARERAMGGRDSNFDCALDMQDVRQKMV